MDMSSDVELVRQPTDQPDGTRDCASRDPAGSVVRVEDLR